jgi:hypothetical protein
MRHIKALFAVLLWLLIVLGEPASSHAQADMRVDQIHAKQLQVKEQIDRLKRELESGMGKIVQLNASNAELVLMRETHRLLSDIGDRQIPELIGELGSLMHGYSTQGVILSKHHQILRSLEKILSHYDQERESNMLIAELSAHLQRRMKNRVALRKAVLSGKAEELLSVNQEQLEIETHQLVSKLSQTDMTQGETVLSGDEARALQYQAMEINRQLKAGQFRDALQNEESMVKRLKEAMADILREPGLARMGALKGEFERMLQEQSAVSIPSVSPENAIRSAEMQAQRMRDAEIMAAKLENVIPEAAYSLGEIAEQMATLQKYHELPKDRRQNASNIEKARSMQDAILEQMEHVNEQVELRQAVQNEKVQRQQALSELAQSLSDVSKNLQAVAQTNQESSERGQRIGRVLDRLERAAALATDVAPENVEKLNEIAQELRSASGAESGLAGEEGLIDEIGQDLAEMERDLREQAGEKSRRTEAPSSGNNQSEDEAATLGSDASQGNAPIAGSNRDSSSAQLKDPSQATDDEKVKGSSELSGEEAISNTIKQKQQNLDSIQEMVDQLSQELKPDDSRAENEEGGPTSQEDDKAQAEMGSPQSEQVDRLHRLLAKLGLPKEEAGLAGGNGAPEGKESISAGEDQEPSSGKKDKGPPTVLSVLSHQQNNLIEGQEIDSKSEELTTYIFEQKEIVKSLRDMIQAQESAFIQTPPDEHELTIHLLLRSTETMANAAAEDLYDEKYEAASTAQYKVIYFLHSILEKENRQRIQWAHRILVEIEHLLALKHMQDSSSALSGGSLERLQQQLTELGKVHEARVAEIQLRASRRLAQSVEAMRRIQVSLRQVHPDHLEISQRREEVLQGIDAAIDILRELLPEFTPPPKLPPAPLPPDAKTQSDQPSDAPPSQGEKKSPGTSAGQDGAPGRDGEESGQHKQGDGSWNPHNFGIGRSENMGEVEADSLGLSNESPRADPASVGFEIEGASSVSPEYQPMVEKYFEMISQESKK